MSLAGTTIPATGIGVWEGARVLTPQDGAGVVTDVSPDNEYGITVSFGRGDRRPLGYLLRDLHLDLTHRMTRTDVVVRMAERLNWRRGVQPAWICIWMHVPDDATERERRMYEEANRTWRMIATADNLMQDWTGRVMRNQTSTRTIPALADLDPTDDTRLDDGARLVDVRALAIVAAQVFGSG